MKDSERPTSPGAQIVVPCADLDAAVAHCVDTLGFRLDMIMPADTPRIAVVSKPGVALRLVVDAQQPPTLQGLRIHVADDDAPLEIPQGRQAFSIAQARGAQAWAMGRAGMQYRDLIPDRCGGRFVASHIRIPDAGPVADYVHHHRIRFQMIYCHRGWVRVVYEDQGPPFVMQAGDCVLQPPSIRHRVLESSPGLEVIEIGCPAEHETLRDHDLALPTPHEYPQRSFAGQRFVHHVAAQARWQRGAAGSFRDTGIADATCNLAGVRVLRVEPQLAHGASRIHDGECLFLFVLNGQALLRSDACGTHTLDTDDACLIPTGADYAIDAAAPCEVLEVALPAKID